ncbi:MAG TPA: hypothetical protein VGS28_03385 [Candidatus Saccharimonadales bacterium]|nr:hypothetical protein [Candidatus Saccharimonadales bacterium]
MSQLELQYGPEWWTPPNVLVSLWPRYASEVIAGRKRFEFRRGLFIKRAATAFIYATAPKGREDRELTCSALVAVARFGPPIIGIEAVSALIAREQAGGSLPTTDWLGGYDTASAHPIEQVHRLNNPIGLAEIRERFPGFQPPQRHISLDRNPTFLFFLRERSGLVRI